MKEKKWIDCPSCGSKGTMKYRKNISEKYHHNNYKPITIDHLDGQFCTVCNEGFFSIKAMKRINSILAEEKAKQDSSRVVASDLLEIDNVTKILNVTRQRVNQMMNEGKLHYVYVGNTRYPTKNNKFDALKKRIHSPNIRTGI